jgi:peptidyl-prolyl cis-trans isomerase D
MIKSGATQSEGKLKYEMEANKVSLCCWFIFHYQRQWRKSDWCWDIGLHEKNEKKFKAEETREVEYVLIADEASKRMRLELKKE